MKNEKFEEYTEKLREIYAYMNPEEPEDEDDFEEVELEEDEENEFGTPVEDDLSDDDFDWNDYDFGTPID
jgi:hypothetical protein